MLFVEIVCYHCGWVNQIEFTEANLKKWTGFFGSQRDRNKPSPTLEFTCQNCGKLNIKSTTELSRLLEEANSTRRVSIGERLPSNWKPTLHRASPDG